jgi:hypothetical protein
MIYRLLFALRLITLFISRDMKRSGFILKILPRVLGKRVRISTILAYKLEPAAYRASE